MTVPHFEVDLIVFENKRLGLTHNPRTESTIDLGATFNEKHKAISRWKFQFLPKLKKK